MLVKVCVHWQWALLEVELERREVAVEAMLMWNKRQLVCWYCCLTGPFSSFLICHSWPIALVSVLCGCGVQA